MTLAIFSLDTYIVPIVEMLTHRSMNEDAQFEFTAMYADESSVVMTARPRYFPHVLYASLLHMLRTCSLFHVCYIGEV